MLKGQALIAPPPARGAIDAAFAPMAGAPGLLIAVSGGPDSIALMLIAHEWAGRQANPPRLFTATVDHGLRGQSAQEAARVGEWARAIGLPHRTLLWAGAKPATAIHEAARAARYSLLCAHGRALGASHLLTAHHADDQAETVLMRMARGSGLTGLAGMAALREREGLIHARPLLTFPKAALEAFRRAAGHPCFEDPSNRDPRFARARWRAAAPQLAALGLDAPVLDRLAERLRRADDALAAIAAAVRESLPRAGVAIDLRPLRGQPEEISLRALAGLVACEGTVPLRLERLERLHARLLAALRQGVAMRATLAGQVVRLDAKGWLTLAPEGRRRRGQRTLPFTNTGASAGMEDADSPASLGKARPEPYIGLQDRANSDSLAEARRALQPKSPLGGHETVQE